MLLLFVLAPVLVFGGIVWGIIALVRRPATERFTLATGISAYAHLFVIVGALMLISGVATSIKSSLGYADLHYSYATHEALRPVDGADTTVADRQRDRADDLVQGLTLTLLGGAVLGAHLLIARSARRRQGGAPVWIVRGTPLMLTVLTALGGLTALATGLHQLLSFALLGAPAGRSPDPFGEQIGYALAFVPVWAGALLWLLRSVRNDNAGGRAGIEAADQRASDLHAASGSIY